MLYLGCPNMSITRHVILKIANCLVNHDITMKDNKVKNCLLFIIDSFIIVKKCERSVKEVCVVGGERISGLFSLSLSVYILKKKKDLQYYYYYYYLFIFFFSRSL